MSDGEMFFITKLSDGEKRKILIKHSFDDLCSLSKSQLDIYMDEIHNSNGTIYNNPYKINLDAKYSVNDIKQAIYKLSTIFPVLSARIVTDGDDVSFAFDADFLLIEGTVADANSFVSPFNLEKNLSKFLIIENNDSKLLYVDLHQLIFDYQSLNILLDTLISILNDDCDFVDDGVLRHIDLENFIIDSHYENDASIFYETMLSDQEDVYELLPSIKKDLNEDFKYISSFDININYLNSFLDNHSISHNQLFTCVFAYTLSRFSGSSKVLFNLVEDVRSQIDSPNSIGMLSNTLPLLFDCKNQSIDSYLKYSINLINSTNEFILYPFGTLKKEYGLNSNISFQYLSNSPHDFEELNHDMNCDLSFIISCEDTIEIKILYSDKYSKEFIAHFADSFNSILQDIMKVTELSQINYIFSSDLKILNSFNQTETSLNYDDILDAFNDNLSKYPDRELVSSNGVSYTYCEGAFIADKIAKRLFEFGVGVQDNVAFLTERSEYYMFSVLGILSTGAVFVPLDDKHPDDRLQFILQDTNSKVVIVSDETYERAKELVNEGSEKLKIFKKSITNIKYYYFH